ncbi:MAG: hypothetical protein LBS21_00815 [Clostridiales bacterium]|nr:hypothetical protein [Clostridiales bacterium]
MTEANKKCKDSLIRHIFNEPGKTLQFHNAVTGKRILYDVLTNLKDKELNNMVNSAMFF